MAKKIVHKDELLSWQEIADILNKKYKENTTKQCYHQRFLRILEKLRIKLLEDIDVAREVLPENDEFFEEPNEYEYDSGLYGGRE
tara:strand:+ start:370 stop:624 length:255 start_codon:yes stop_codon:yes gene_type:complete